MPFSLRLDEETERAIDYLARQSGRSRASVVREAVAHYAAAADEGMTAYDKLRPLIGVVKSGRTDLSQRTGRTFTALLRQQRTRRARRPR
jgi:predicted DNA-binding protein